MSEIENLTEKNGAPPQVEYLFHGTSQTDPQKIIKSEEGFDLRLSKAGMWGHAIYFAENSKYSSDYYAY